MQWKRGGFLLNSRKVKVGLCILLLLTAVTLVVFFLISSSGKINSGVRIEGVSFSGYTKKGAADKLNQIYSDKLKNSKIILSCQGQVWEIPYKEIDAKYDIRTAVEHAFSVGKGRNIFKNLYDAISAAFKGRDIQVRILYDKQSLKKRLQEIAKLINKPGKDATIVVEKGDIPRIIPEQPGIKLDIERSVKLIEDNLTSAGTEPVQLSVEAQIPRYTTKSLKDVDGLIANASTAFNSAETNRSYNIRNALKTINGTILLPGEVFSLNEVLGPRSEKNGYKSAPVILNNQLVPGMGGGVCQVATTMYSAVLQACVEVVERQHHTFPPAYIAPGQDATIAGNNIDFKFKNNTGFPVFISAQAPGGKIQIKIFSKKSSPNRSVKIESQIMEVEDPGPDKIIRDDSLQEGVSETERPSKKGYKVSVFRNIYEGDKLVKRELVSNDHYRPIRGIVRIGTAPAEESEDVIMQYPDWYYGTMENNIEEPDNPPDQEFYYQNLY